MSGDAGLAVQRTRCWLQRIVIDLNLCPFAAGPYQRETVLYRVCTETDFESVYQSFLEALGALWASEPGHAETGLLIFTSALAEFDDYLDALDACERAVVAVGLEGEIQVASFHPHYRFADSAEDDQANFTNRSPYPMFHLIREQELGQALAAYTDPAGIPERNIRRLRALGVEGINSLLESCD